MSGKAIVQCDTWTLAENNRKHTEKVKDANAGKVKGDFSGFALFSTCNYPKSLCRIAGKVFNHYFRIKPITLSYLYRMAALAPMAFKAAMPLMMKAAASPGVRQAFTGLGQNGSLLQSLGSLNKDAMSSGINTALQNGSVINMWQKLSGPSPSYNSALPGPTRDTISIPAPLNSSMPRPRSSPGNSQSGCQNCCSQCACCNRQVRGGKRRKKQTKRNQKRRTRRLYR